MITFFAVLIRIISNSMSNVFQKRLTISGVQPYVINFLTYLGLSLICIPFVFRGNFECGHTAWLNAILGGLFGALGNYYLIKALKSGELSVLGPINAYKSVVAMILGIFLLGEIPSWVGIAAVGLIICGSYLVFDATEEGFSLRLLRQKFIRYRIYALVFTAIEAVFIKNVIIYTDTFTAFCFWCWFGALFSLVNVLLHKEKIGRLAQAAYKKLFLIIVCVGIMQYSTNVVFARMNVAYGLALFQLSAILSVLLGWKYFREKNILKKLTGTVIMVIGATILIILK